MDSRTPNSNNQRKWLRSVGAGGRKDNERGAGNGRGSGVMETHHRVYLTLRKRFAMFCTTRIMR